MIQLLMLSTCSRCGRQEAVTCWTSVGETLTAALPTRWRQLPGGVVCDRCDHGAAANVVPFPTHLCSPRGSIPQNQRAA